MYREEFECWRQWLNLPVWNPVSLGNWIWWLLCLGWKVGSTRTNLLASQLRNTGELLEPLPALKQQQQKEKDWKTPLLSLLLSPYSSSSSLLLIERYLHCKLKGPSRVAVLTLMHSPKMSTNKLQSNYRRRFTSNTTGQKNPGYCWRGASVPHLFLSSTLLGESFYTQSPRLTKVKMWWDIWK